MICPNCSETYRWFETVCPVCGVELVERLPGPPPEPNAELVAVFRTEDPALLPLAKIALDAERIEYLLRGPGTGAEWMHATRSAAAQSLGWTEIVVGSSDEARARELLADLAQPAPAAGATPPPLATHAHKDNLEPPTISLQDVESKMPIGQISESQLQFLIDQLEEDPDQEREYYFDPGTIDLIESAGADAGLVDLLKSAVAGREGVQIKWDR